MKTNVIIGLGLGGLAAYLLYRSQQPATAPISIAPALPAPAPASTFAQDAAAVANAGSALFSTLFGSSSSGNANANLANAQKAGKPSDDPYVFPWDAASDNPLGSTSLHL